MNTIKMTIKQIRVGAGLTQEEMAEKLGITRQTYSDREKSGNFTFREVTRICDVTGTPIDIVEIT